MARTKTLVNAASFKKWKKIKVEKALEERLRNKRKLDRKKQSNASSSSDNTNDIKIENEDWKTKYSSFTDLAKYWIVQERKKRENNLLTTNDTNELSNEVLNHIKELPVDIKFEIILFIPLYSNFPITFNENRRNTPAVYSMINSNNMEHEIIKQNNYLLNKFIVYHKMRLINKEFNRRMKVKLLTLDRLCLNDILCTDGKDFTSQLYHLCCLLKEQRIYSENISNDKNYQLNINDITLYHDVFNLLQLSKELKEKKNEREPTNYGNDDESDTSMSSDSDSEGFDEQEQDQRIHELLINDDEENGNNNNNRLLLDNQTNNHNESNNNNEEEILSPIKDNMKDMFTDEMIIDNDEFENDLIKYSSNKIVQEDEVEDISLERVKDKKSEMPEAIDYSETINNNSNVEYPYLPEKHLNFLYDFVGNNETITCCDVPTVHSHIFLNFLAKVCTKLRSLNILKMVPGGFDRIVFSPLTSGSIEEITIYSPYLLSKYDLESLLLQAFEDLNTPQLNRINVISFHGPKTNDYNDDEVPDNMVIDLIERNPTTKEDTLVHSYRKPTPQNRRRNNNNNNVRTITCYMTCLSNFRLEDWIELINYGFLIYMPDFISNYLRLIKTGDVKSKKELLDYFIINKEVPIKNLKLTINSNIESFISLFQYLIYIANEYQNGELITNDLCTYNRADVYIHAIKYGWDFTKQIEKLLVMLNYTRFPEENLKSLLPYIKDKESTLFNLAIKCSNSGDYGDEESMRFLHFVLKTIQSSTTEERFRELLISPLKLKIKVNEHNNKLLKQSDNNAEEQPGFVEVTVPFIGHALLNLEDFASMEFISLLTAEDIRSIKPNEIGDTILHILLSKSSICAVVVIELLRKCPELVNAQNNYGQTPLHLTLLDYDSEGDLLIAERLVHEFKADIHLKDKFGFSPVDVAARLKVKAEFLK
ncbi:hypothetical protein ABK040_014446 [Willaertia magna]